MSGSRNVRPECAMTPLQPRPDLEVPAIVRKARRPRTPPLRRPMFMRAMCLVAVSAGIGAATILSAPRAVHEPLISMQVSEPKSAFTPRIAEASLRPAQ